MNVLLAALLAVAVGAVVYVIALGAKAHLGEQREQVAVVLALVAGTGTFATPLLLSLFTVPTL